MQNKNLPLRGGGGGGGGMNIFWNSGAFIKIGVDWPGFKLTAYCEQCHHTSSQQCFHQECRSYEGSDRHDKHRP